MPKMISTTWKNRDILSIIKLLKENLDFWMEEDAEEHNSAKDLKETWTPFYIFKFKVEFGFNVIVTSTKEESNNKYYISSAYYVDPL